MTATALPRDAILPLLPSDTERQRYLNAIQNLGPWAHLFRDQRCLDFGASWGTSMVAMLRLGASYVVGVETDAERVADGKAVLRGSAPLSQWEIRYSSDTRHLNWNDEYFGVVLVNAVFEHIPQPRDAYIRECWRVLKPGGYLIVNETPNKYWPREDHTTHAPGSSVGGLWFNHWLPKSWAYRRAVRRGRFDPSRTDWDSSGWRGLGYYEMVKPLTNYRLIPETLRPRHRFLTRLGLPASLIDPYPCWVLQKG